MLGNGLLNKSDFLSIFLQNTRKMACFVLYDKLPQFSPYSDLTQSGNNNIVTTKTFISSIDKLWIKLI